MQRHRRRVRIDSRRLCWGRSPSLLQLHSSNLSLAILVPYSTARHSSAVGSLTVHGPTLATLLPTWRLLIVGNRGVTGDASVPATIPNITTSDNEAFIFTLKQLFHEKNKAEYKRLELAQSSRTFKDEY
jgi:hypothetical protein